MGWQGFTIRMGRGDVESDHGGREMDLGTVVPLSLFSSLVLFGVVYVLSPHLRKVTRERVRGNFGNAAGVDAGVGGIAFLFLAAATATVAIGFDSQSLGAWFLGAVVLLGTFVGLLLLGVSLYAFLYGGPRWAVRDSRDLWVAEARKTMRENRKSKVAPGDPPP